MTQEQKAHETDGVRVAVVGVTGVVGQTMLRILQERNFPVSELIPIASAKSQGKSVLFQGVEVPIRPLEAASFKGVTFALFSAGASVSREFCPVAAAAGAIVIDNSSAWRQDPDVPLVVPEVNLGAAKIRPKGIIANPNCSTIQMVVALKPIHDAFGIRRVIVATYQAVSGAGAKAVESLHHQHVALTRGDVVPGLDIGHQLAGNLLMTWKPEADTGYSEEEMKMVRETQKIMGDSTIRVSPTTVRVPVATVHSEAVTIETAKPTDARAVRALLADAPGVELVDDFSRGIYPQPIHAVDKDAVFVGRIRDDIGNPGGVQMWIVSDNLRKGAALNAIQIAEALLSPAA